MTVILSTDSCTIMPKCWSTLGLLTSVLIARSAVLACFTAPDACLLPVAFQDCLARCGRAVVATFQLQCLKSCAGAPCRGPGHGLRFAPKKYMTYDEGGFGLSSFCCTNISFHLSAENPPQVKKCGERESFDTNEQVIKST